MTRIRFILDGEILTVDIHDPTRTVLQYLREDINRTGSKEGCAEGDCGACTVVIAEAIDGQIQYKAVNACIQFLPTLDGKALFTVESLKQSDGSLHPVQQALVDYHGSQCGFCTPGFVMSLFALYKKQHSPDRAEIDNVLSGNLCRCTGYRPIVEAAFHMHDYDEIDTHEQALLERLEQINTEEDVPCVGDNYFAPTELSALADLYQRMPQATLLAGGTDVGLWVTKQLRELPVVIYLGNVEALKEIKHSSQGIEIGAAVSLEQAFTHLNEIFPELREMCRRFASMPVRNAGTLVGNIANGSPIGDSMPALICIGARLRLRLGEQTREIPLQDLYLDYMKNAMRPGEFIESVIVPPRQDGIQLQCYKLSKRYDQDISAVFAAFALSPEGDRVGDIKIAFGGMAAIPKRAEKTEGFLAGKAWNEDSVRQAMEILKQEFQPLSDMRASAAYRQQVSANLLYRFYLQTSSNTDLNVFEVTA